MLLPWRRYCIIKTRSPTGEILE